MYVCVYVVENKWFLHLNANEALEDLVGAQRAAMKAEQNGKTQVLPWLDANESLRGRC